MIDAVIHCGHTFRKTGFTGTSGMLDGRRLTEQDYVAEVGKQATALLELRGYSVFLAHPTINEDRMPRCKVFVSLHQDGSVNPLAQGSSTGYPAYGDGKVLAQIIKAHHARNGWPSGFRRDNYTGRSLSNFYGFRKIHADAKCLWEIGFGTNAADQRWMWENLGTVAKALADALMQYLGVGKPPLPEMGDEGMILMHDTDSNTWRVAVPGEGSAVIDEPSHWAGVISEGRKTGVYSSPYVSNLIEKIRAESG